MNETPWRQSGGGIGLNRYEYTEAEPTQPSKESLRRGEVRRRLELLQEQKAIEAELSDVWVCEGEGE